MVTKVVVGVAGGGKTSYLMDIVEQELRGGLKASQIGFASFSRAAIAEAAQRASRITGEDVSHLTKNCWFKTLHAAALRCLGLDTRCILDHDSEDGKKFLNEAVGCERGGDPGTLGNKVDLILSKWDYSRSRLNRLNPDPSGQDDKYPRLPDGQRHTGHTKTYGNIMSSGVTVRAFSSDFGSESVSSRLYPYRDNSKKHIDQDAISKCVSPVFLLKSLYRTQGKVETVTPKALCPEWGAKQKSQCFHSKRGTAWEWTDDEARVITAYERSKSMYGRLDFCDILMRYAGVTVQEDLTFSVGYGNGVVPEELEVFIFDEMQDASDLLGLVAQRLSEGVRDTHWAGDAYQAVYGFSGGSGAVFAAKEDVAKQEGNRILLNRSWRNPPQILEWGEEILREDKDYDERKPISEVVDGSVGLMDSEDFMKCLPKLAGSDTMILARTWFALAKVKAKLDEFQIPWMSCQEKQSSRWSCPAKIAYTLTMKDLMAGEKISEQDWRRVCDTIPQKFHGVEMFTRGTKAKWKKLECSGMLVRRLNELEEWGATTNFIDFVQQGRWRVDMPLLLDLAIDRYGIKEVREPSIRIGTVHSVKGMEARNVFCLAGSTGRIERDGDPAEELCLKYVAVTRAAKHYRLVVDAADLARGKSLFWAAPRGVKGYLKGFDDAGSRHSDADCQMVQDEWDMGGQIPRGDLRDDRDAGPHPLREGQIRSPGSQKTGKTAEKDPGVPAERNQEDWWDL